MDRETARRLRGLGGALAWDVRVSNFVAAPGPDAETEPDPKPQTAKVPDPKPPKSKVVCPFLSQFAKTKNMRHIIYTVIQKYEALIEP